MNVPFDPLTDPLFRNAKLAHGCELPILGRRVVFESNSHARGRFVAFLDSDDLWKPLKLERQVTALKSSGVQWSYTGYEIVDDSGRSRRQFVAAQPKEATILDQLLTTEASAAVGSVLVAKDLIDRCGGFSAEPALQCREDHDIVLRLASAAHPSIVSDVLVAIREHRGRTTHSVSDPFLLTARVYEKFMERVVTRSRCGLPDA